MAGEIRVLLPGGLSIGFVNPPARHVRYIAGTLGLEVEPDCLRPANLTVRFFPRLPLTGRGERIGEFAGWSGDTFWVGDLRGARMAWSPATPLGQQWQCERAFAPDALWAYLWWALRAAWRERGAVLLHASGALWRGQGVALMGWSGAGKTTLLRELLRRGAGFLGDDWVLVSPGRIERCSLEIRMPDGRRRSLARALPGTVTEESAPLAAVCLLTTVEDGTVEPGAWDARAAAVRMAACLRHEGAVFAHACDAFRFFRPEAVTPFDDAEARDAALLADIFARARGSVWSIPFRADPTDLGDAVVGWLDG